MKGAPASFASRRAISVLPTPVGPIIKMFFGSTSSRKEPWSCCRRQRLRSAIETARLASAWPTMLGCVVDELPPVHYQMLAFGGGVRVAPYATFGSRELADHVHAALEGRSAALMQNHGAVCFASDCTAATELALLLEWACEVYWRARAIGDPRVLSDAELAGVVEAVQQRGYGQVR